MGLKHDKIAERASRALQAVHDDMSVSHEWVLDSLELLRDEIDMFIISTKESMAYPRGRLIKSRYPIDTAYDEGLEYARSSLPNDNPYDPNTEGKWLDVYERGYIDGLEEE